MSYSGYNSGHNTAPSAPPIPESQSKPGVAYPYQPPPQQQSQQPNYGQQLNYAYNYGSNQNPNTATGYGGLYGYQTPSSTTSFPPGTHPEVIRSFQMVDLDRSGFIDVKELQQALSSAYQKFSIRTIRLLMFQFRNPNDPFRTGLFFYFDFICLLCLLMLLLMPKTKPLCVTSRVTSRNLVFTF